MVFKLQFGYRTLLIGIKKMEFVKLRFGGRWWLGFTSWNLTGICCLSSLRAEIFDTVTLDQAYFLGNFMEAN